MSSTNDEWFVIKDLDGLINSARLLVYNSFSDTDKEKTDADSLCSELDDEHQQELDKILSFEESKLIVMSLVKKQKNKKTHETRLLMSDKTFSLIIESLNDRMVSNLLNSLVNKGLVETAYDAEADDFIFWIKDNEKPEID